MGITYLQTVSRCQDAENRASKTTVLWHEQGAQTSTRSDMLHSGPLTPDAHPMFSASPPLRDWKAMPTHCPAWLKTGPPATGDGTLSFEHCASTPMEASMGKRTAATLHAAACDSFQHCAPELPLLMAASICTPSSSVLLWA